MTFPPARMLSTTRSDSRAIDSIRALPSRLRLTAMLSFTRWRMTPRTNAAAAASSTSGSATTASALLLSLMDAPGRQTVRRERKFSHFSSQLEQRVRHPVAPLKGAVEEHVAAATRTRHLAPECALGDGRLIGGVDEVVGDLRGEPLLLLPRGTEQLAELGEAALQQGVLHLQGKVLAGSQAGERLLIPTRPALGLVLDDVVGGAGLARVAEQHVVLELVHDVVGDAQRIDDHAVALELDQVEAAKGGGVLILKPTLDPEVPALQLEGHLRDVIVGERLPMEVLEQPDQRDHHRRGGAQARARGRVGMQEQVVSTTTELADRRLGEIQPAVEDDLLVGEIVEREAEVDALQADLVVRPRRECTVGVPVDRRAEDEAALLLRERWDVGSATGKADAQRGFGVNDAHGVSLRRERRVGGGRRGPSSSAARGRGCPAAGSAGTGARAPGPCGATTRGRAAA